MKTETIRPRLRTRTLLFGVVVASATSSLAAHYALCDRDGAPACGNIGQAGSPLPPPAPINISVAAQTAPLVEITVSQQLVAPRPEPKPAVVQPAVQPNVEPVVQPAVQPVVAQPLVDARGDFMPGNVMSKGGSRR